MFRAAYKDPSSRPDALEVRGSLVIPYKTQRAGEVKTNPWEVPWTYTLILAGYRTDVIKKRRKTIESLSRTKEYIVRFTQCSRCTRYQN